MTEATEYVEKENRITRATERFGRALETYVREIVPLKNQISPRMDSDDVLVVVNKIQAVEDRLMDEARSCADIALTGFNSEQLGK